MRVCRTIIAIAGLALSVILATAESFAAHTGASLTPAFRDWLLASGIIIAVAIATLLVVEHLIKIETELHQINQQRRAEGDYADVERRIRHGRGNLTTLYPEE